MNASFSRAEIIVFVSGMISMGLEILAGRVLAPSFGSTIYTWGSVIGVALFALSLGYHQGGRRASRASQGSLTRYMLYTAGYIIVLMAAGDVVVSLTAALPVSPRYAAILPMLVLFGPPTYALGFVNPCAVELSKREGKGEASGHFYAVGTAGSLVGAFGTTFLLIPLFSITTIYAVFAAFSVFSTIRRFASTRLFLLPLIVTAPVLFGDATIPGESVYEESTPYQELRVVDHDGVRTMYLDGQPQSAMYLDNRTGYPWTYTRYFHIPMLLREDITRVLFIGGGGFSGPKRFSQAGITTDVVELDPGVIDAAKRYFRVEESEHLQIVEGDGRRFLERSNNSYDIIFVDAYRKTSVPFHLTTREFMEVVHQRLDEDGAVFSSVIGSRRGPGSRFPRSQYKTVSEVFRSTYYVPTSNTTLAQNIAVIGSKNPSLTRDEVHGRDESYEVLNLSYEVDRVTQPDVAKAPVLTDSYAPVDALLDPLVGRRYVPASQ